MQREKKDWYARWKEKDRRMTDLFRSLNQGTCSLTEAELKRKLKNNKNRMIGVRVEEFHSAVGLLFESARTELYPGDRTQPSIEELAYRALSEALWRVAEEKGADTADAVADDATELINVTFRIEYSNASTEYDPDEDDFLQYADDYDPG